MRRPILLWGAFLIVHVLVAWLGWVYPSQPMGDVVLVYQPWSDAALRGGAVVGITQSWVYPQFALVPMLAAHVLAAPLVPALGVLSAYLIAWATLVTALDAVGFAVLVGRRPTRARRSAGWFWTAAVLLLGPIALYRIDAVTVPLAVVGGLWLVRRPAAGAALLAIGAWIKIWPGALVVAALAAGRGRWRVLAAATGTVAGIVVVLFLLGADRTLLGFLTQQTARGLQIESVAATPFLWLVPAGAAAIDYSPQILTFQISAPGADVVSALLTPLMAVGVLAVAVLAAARSARGASVTRLLPPTALSLVAMLIATNKVGSPQFQTWLLAPVVLWIVLDRTRAAAPVALVLVLCGLTCLVYPLTYDGLLQAQLLPVLLLSVRNVLLVCLLALGIRRLAAVPVRP